MDFSSEVVRVIGKNCLMSFQVVSHSINLSMHDLLTCEEVPLTHCLID